MKQMRRQQRDARKETGYKWDEIAEVDLWTNEK